MPDETIAWLCSDAMYNIETIYNIVQKNISARPAQSGAR